MRMRYGFTALAAALLLAMPAMAQTTATFGGADPTKIVNQPIAVPQTVNNSFSLASFFPSFSLPSIFKPTLGQSAFPTPKNMPGKAYLQNFGYQRPQPIQ